MSKPICQHLLYADLGITDDCHLDYKTPVMSAFCFRVTLGLTMWTDGVIVVLSLSADLTLYCRSLHLMSIDSMSKEEVFNFLRNLLAQLLS